MVFTVKLFALWLILICWISLCPFTAISITVLAITKSEGDDSHHVFIFLLTLWGAITTLGSLIAIVLRHARLAQEGITFARDGNEDLETEVIFCEIAGLQHFV